MRILKIIRTFAKEIKDNSMAQKITPTNITELKPNEVFVFGSNMKGMHIGGAARVAADKFGAEWGNPIGLQGQSYAIPTMFKDVEDIRPYVESFIKFAEEHSELFFYVTPIGCGIAGFEPSEIAPLFKHCIGMQNVALPQEFLQ